MLVAMGDSWYHVMPLQLSENLQEALSEKRWGQAPYLAAFIHCLVVWLVGWFDLNNGH